ncbi:hypothetical protein F4811DRAFT_548915 [Daldinia bambusicola]|nr:hypothetical protein F4811DRAFT_548915 [Daldinia bambusicola]
MVAGFMLNGARRSLKAPTASVAILAGAAFPAEGFDGSKVPVDDAIDACQVAPDSLSLVRHSFYLSLFSCGTYATVIGISRSPAEVAHEADRVCSLSKLQVMLVQPTRRKSPAALILPVVVADGHG